MLTDSAFYVLLSLVILFGVMASTIGWFALRSFARDKKQIRFQESESLDGPQLEPKIEAKVEAEVKPEVKADPKKPAEEPKPDYFAKTRTSFWSRLRATFETPSSQADQLAQIEEVLYTADLGPSVVESLLSSLEKESFANSDQLKVLLKKRLLAFFDENEDLPTSAQERLLNELQHSRARPYVLLIVGVNGAGKTTSIGKLAAMAAESGKKVLVTAGDTFRAAAQGQLKVWAERAQVEIFSPPNVTDPGAVAFDAIQKAKANGFDLVIIDTAGRLHTQSQLMAELEKVQRVIKKAEATAPHGCWIVLDANTGQNGVLQAREFSKAMGLNGAILTKMDGTAKGGVVFAVRKELGIPILFLGVGEKQNDLIPFSAEEFVSSILE